MKYPIIICGSLLFLIGFTPRQASAGQAFDALSAAAAGGDVPAVFDGAAEKAEILPELKLSTIVVSINGLQSGGRRLPGAIPMPVETESGEEQSKLRANAGVVLDAATEKPAFSRAIKKLASIKSGKELVSFLESEGVEVKWKILAAADSEPNFAEVCPPEICGGKKVIYLNSLKTGAKDYKSMFLDSNPTFLAVALAHELTHLSDIKNIGGTVQRKSQAHLFLELNGYSAEVYVYHQLLLSGIAPKPNSIGESYEIQRLRLSLAIRDYINGGAYPNYLDFNKIGGPPNFDYYVGRASNGERKGSMSLAGVVEVLYEFDPDLENLQKPAYSASSEEKTAYKQAKKIKRSLDLSTADYIKWRNVTVGVPTAPPQQHTPWNHPSSNDDEGGGSNGGDVGVDVGGWHPHPGSGQATWD